MSLPRLVARVYRKLLPRPDPRGPLRVVLGGERLIAVDVGAAGGLLEHWECLPGVATVYLVEPGAEAARALEARYRDAPSIKIVPRALSAHGGRRTLHVTNVASGSSLLPPNMAGGDFTPDDGYIFPLSRVEVETEPLRAVLAAFGETRADIMKIDTQGAEREVLGGLGAALGELTCVELEVGLRERYAGEPTLGELDELLRGAGLELLDLKVIHNHRRMGGDDAHYPRLLGVRRDAGSVSARAWEADAIYARRPQLVLERRDAAALRRLIASYGLHGFFGEALHWIEQARVAGLFPAAEAAALRDAILAWHRGRRRFVEGLSIPARVVRGLLGWLGYDLARR